jgi:hypothetical protein
MTTAAIRGNQGCNGSARIAGKSIVDRPAADVIPDCGDTDSSAAPSALEHGAYIPLDHRTFLQWTSRWGGTQHESGSASFVISSRILPKRWIPLPGSAPRPASDFEGNARSRCRARTPPRDPHHMKRLVANRSSPLQTSQMGYGKMESRMSKRRPDPGQIAATLQQIEASLVFGMSRSLVLFTMLAVSFILFFLISIEWFNINDFMYGVAAAVWAQHGQLYTDVPFVQAPLSIILTFLPMKIIGSADIFLVGRIMSILLVLGAVLAPLIDKEKRKDVTISVLYIAASLTNAYICSNSREIGNYAFPLLCLSVSVTIINMRGPALWRGFFACAAIGLAASTKLYFIVMCPGIFFMFLLYEKCSHQPKVIAGCIVGFLLGCAPILYFLMLDYQNFLKWNVYFFISFLNLRKEPMMGGPVSLTQVINATLEFLFQMSIPLAFMIAGLVEEYRHFGSGPRAAGRLILVVSAYAMAISPFFVFVQYFAPLALLLLQFSIPHPLTSEKLRFRYVIFLVVLFCAQAGIMIERGIWYYSSRSGGLDVLEVIKLQGRAREIVDDQYKCERKFYSAEPLFLLDNKIKYPSELAAGPFLLFLSRRDLTGIGKDFDVIARINRWKPDVVIWGYFLENITQPADEVDRIIRDYAIEQKFKIAPLGQFDGRDIYLGYRSECKP